MNIIPPSYEIEPFDGIEMMKRVEKAGKTCYQSEGTITVNSYDPFIRMIIKRGHESVLEHEKITVRLICDRGISHEVVRHRIASYSQESTRYCNYGKKDIQFIDIRPHFKDINWKTTIRDEASWIRDAELLWKQVLELAEKNYKRMIALGVSPQLARSVLPNSLKTEIVITMNLREWRHFFALRTDKAAHPQMREVAIPLFKELKQKLPSVFDDIG
jgi:thymidylate synthase (FAD)